jgi:hypothetical protein
LPKVLRWRAQRHLFRFYGELRYLEDKLRRVPVVEHPALLDRLDVLDQIVGTQSFPRGLSEMRYNLRLHIDLVSQRYGALRAGLPTNH